jgi:serine/threonine protein phosphatase PrpC
MEDAHLVELELLHGFSMFGVFDGHGAPAIFGAGA